MKHLHPLLWLAAATVLGTAGCGGPSASEVTPEPGANAPRWRLAREDVPAEGTAMTLVARGPARLRFRMESTHQLGRTGGWHQLAAGQTVRIEWSHAPAPELARQEVASPEQEAEGRTEVHCLLLSFQLAQEIQAREAMFVWTRPGRGQVLTRDLLPPGRTADLPPKANLELCTLAVADLAEAEATLRSVDWKGVLRREGPQAPGDRVEIVRLFLEVETLTGG